MLCFAPGKATKHKKAIYLLASTFLGMLVSFIAYAFIEIKTIRFMYHQGNLAYFQSGQNAWLALEMLFLFLGALGGFLAGRFWWRKIYVERAWMKKKIIN